MHLPMEYLLDSSNDRRVSNEGEHSVIIPSRNLTTVTPYILEIWRETMVFWKNHDTCRRMFNWVREVLGSLDEDFLKKIFYKLINDGELVNEHVRMYLFMRGCDIKGRDIIDIPYWMHAAFLQVLHLIYLDDDIMLSEPIEELTRPRLLHKNAKSIEIMLNIFFDYITERPFLMAEFPMNNWKNNVDHIGGAEISTDNFDEGDISPIGDMVDEDCTERKEICPIIDLEPSSVDSTSCIEDCSTEDLGDSVIQSGSTPADIFIDCPPDNEGVICTEDEESIRLDADNQLGPIPSLMDAHPSWDTLVFQNSPRRTGRKSRLQITAKEKAQFNTLVFSAFFGIEQENVPIASRADDSRLALRAVKGIFFGLTIFFQDRAASHIGQKNLKTLVASSGGKVCTIFKKTATHIVASKPVPWYKLDDLRRSTNCRVVNPKWILECLRIGRRVNESAFNMAGLQQTQPTILSFLNGGTNVQVYSADDQVNKIFCEVNFEESENKGHRVESHVDSDNDVSEIQSLVFDKKRHKEEEDADIDNMGILSKRIRISDE